MQINDHLSITQDSVVCTTCGQLSAQELLSRRTRFCRHASTAEIRRILALLEERHRRRQAPARQVLATVESQNHNGTYEISVLPDGTFACTCLSFLGSRDLEEADIRAGVKAATCKHIREKMAGLRCDARALHREFGDPKAPSDWQKLVFKALSVDAHERLTNAQAYVAIHGLLEKQGVPYPEFEDRMRRQRRVTLLPINAFGVEFEGHGIGHEELAGFLTQAGLPTSAEDYNHVTRDHFKVVSDASIRGSFPFELVTPKLFGADGFAKLRTLCRVVRRNGGDANASCGLHVHVDAWNCKIRDARRLLEVWLRIQPVAQMLLPPSRRNNSFAQPVTPSLVEQVNGLSSIAQLGRIDRYYAVNLNAYARHQTFEFRIHGGTFNAEKVISWAVFVLLVTAAARSGIEPDSIPQTWEGVAEAIGLTTGTSTIQRAHRYLTERYRFFTAAAPSGAASEDAA